MQGKMSRVMRSRARPWLLATVWLVAAWTPASAQVFTTYHCRDGSEFVAAFYEGDKRAHLQLDGKAIALPKRPFFAGARYAKGDITFRIAKKGVTLKRGKRLTDCAAD
jgi:membrane-bound inhibitor of C-type lysozyme